MALSEGPPIFCGGCATATVSHLTSMSGTIGEVVHFDLTLLIVLIPIPGHVMASSWAVRCHEKARLNDLGR